MFQVHWFGVKAGIAYLDCETDLAPGELLLEEAFRDTGTGLCLSPESTGRVAMHV